MSWGPDTTAGEVRQLHVVELVERRFGKRWRKGEAVESGLGLDGRQRESESEERMKI